MSPRLLLRSLTPPGWLLAVVAALVALVMIAGVWNGLTAWLPWSAQSQRDRAVLERNLARSDAAARTLEATGERAQAERVETYHMQEGVIRDLTAQAENQARSAPDASEPLPPDRSARLREHDQRLCDLRPPICETATAEAVGGRNGAVPAGPPA